MYLFRTMCRFVPLLFLLVPSWSVDTDCPNQQLKASGSSLIASLQKQLSFGYEQGPFKITYNSTGSGIGKTQVVERQVDFAASESLLSDDQYNTVTDLQMFPAFASAVCVAYNLPGDPRTNSLNLTKAALALIFAGKVTSWRDPVILSTNPLLDAVLPASSPIRVVRKDSSGTTEVFTSALSAFNSDLFPTKFSGNSWAKGGNLTALITATENSGVSLAVIWTPGAIGYVGHSSAALYNLPVAKILADDGTPVAPTIATVQASMAVFAEELTTRFTGSLANPPGNDTYPIAGYTYYVVRLRTVSCCEKAYWLRKYLLWCATDPRVHALAATEMMATIPSVLVARFTATANSIQCQDGDRIVFVTSLKDRYEPQPKEKSNALLVILVASGCALVIVVLLAVLLRMWRVTRQRARKRLMEANNAPRGTISLVFTDIQGSTALWNARPREMKHALERHNELMRHLIRLEGGYEVKSEGDAFMCSFHTPLEALRFCFRAQESLDMYAWDERFLSEPDTREVTDSHGLPVIRGLRVRMGVGWGPVEDGMDETTLRVDYFGPTVNLTARVAALGHGGQILLTSTAHEWLTKDEQTLRILGNPQIIFLGAHPLKGISQPERIHETASPLHAARIGFFPALRVEKANAELAPKGSSRKPRRRGPNRVRPQDNGKLDPRQPWHHSEEEPSVRDASETESVLPSPGPMIAGQPKRESLSMSIESATPVVSRNASFVHSPHRANGDQPRPFPHQAGPSVSTAV
eukprot:TRINITY_DN10670_c0_g1_i1.p1 TRINITY_DN10670_c0_g1~~TRINITY_DN10670_c0_g1_i1.p1  ORF type:complete len:752 (-),score=107.87 TRINITY_DN10670_c0_g1_i1:120-2375(-)